MQKLLQNRLVRGSFSRRWPWSGQASPRFKGIKPESSFREGSNRLCAENHWISTVDHTMKIIWLTQRSSVFHQISGRPGPPSKVSLLLWCHPIATPVPPSLLLVASPCCPLHDATAAEASAVTVERLDGALNQLVRWLVYSIYAYKSCTL